MSSTVMTVPVAIGPVAIGPVAIGPVAIRSVLTAPLLTGSARPAIRDAAPGQAEAALAKTQLGPLGDADLTKELAQLTALQNRQALGGTSPSATNRAPQTLLSLFGQA